MRDIGFLLREGPKGLQDARATISDDCDFNDAELEKCVSYFVVERIKTRY